MKKLFALAIIAVCITPAQAQFLKKIKDKVTKTADDKQTTAIEKKENDASSEYSDATENHEKPVFSDKAPANGKMVLKLKKGDRFWGGYIQVKSPSKPTDANATILDSATARVGSFYTAGEMSDYAIYIDGQRFLNSSATIPLRPEYIDATKNTDYLVTTEGKSDASTMDIAAVMEQVKANGSKQLSKKEEEEMVKKMAPTTTQGTFTFKYNGKQYGPLQGAGIGMFLLKSMTDGKPSGRFYGLGGEAFIGEKQAGFNAIIQTEKKQVKITDYSIGGLFELTYPTGAMVVAQGKAYHFSNGKTILIPAKPVYQTEGNVIGQIVYATDSGHIVIIPQTMEQMSAGGPKTAYVDYTTKLTYPIEVTKEHLLIASNPAKSVMYKNHKIYYADGREETINNSGDAQLCSFNGKDYIVWFEMIKNADGHEVYVCQKELK